HDPSVGIVKVAKSELSKKFTGIVLEIWPGNSFLKENVKNKISLRAMLENTHGLYSALTKIFFLSIIIESINLVGNDSNLLIVFYVQIMPDDFVMQLHRF
ncbi:TPA: hypothetical protein ACYESB_005115, partial [Klebsiella pneumoniae]